MAPLSSVAPDSITAILNGGNLVNQATVSGIGDDSGLVVTDQSDRLRKRVDQLLAEAKLTLDQETLSREVAILADRCDVAEEIARLDAHLQQFETACAADGDQVGRRLDFISQEMLREANTIASKASDVTIGQLTVNIKCHIDRIKEQIQNVE